MSVISDAEVAALLAPIREALASPGGLVIHTSGTLGTPKLVRLSAQALRSSAQATLQVLGGPGQWLVALSPTVIAGAQMLVRSILADTTPVVLSGQFDAETFLSAAQQLSGDRRYTSLVPVQLARLLEHCDEHPDAFDILRRFDAILVGGQALEPALREQALASGLNVIRTYGGTETAGGCVYEGVPIGDTQIRIGGGEVLISGSCLAEGYDNDPELTRARFTVETGVDDNSGLSAQAPSMRWFHTRDSGELFTDDSGQQRLRITGRLDRVLISGGVKVSLDALEAAVRECRGWRSAFIVAVPDNEWGERPVVVVEQGQGSAPRDESNVDPFEQVQAHVEARMGRVAVPDRFALVEEIPRLPSGKPDLQALADVVSH